MYALHPYLVIILIIPRFILVFNMSSNSSECIEVCMVLQAWICVNTWHDLTYINTSIHTYRRMIRAQLIRHQLVATIHDVMLCVRVSHPQLAGMWPRQVDAVHVWSYISKVDVYIVRGLSVHFLWLYNKQMVEDAGVDVMWEYDRQPVFWWEFYKCSMSDRWQTCRWRVRYLTSSMQRVMKMIYKCATC